MNSEYFLLRVHFFSKADQNLKFVQPALKWLWAAILQWLHLIQYLTKQYIFAMYYSLHNHEWITRALPVDSTNYDFITTKDFIDVAGPDLNTNQKEYKWRILYQAAEEEAPEGDSTEVACCCHDVACGWCQCSCYDVVCRWCQCSCYDVVCRWCQCSC